MPTDEFDGVWFRCHTDDHSPAHIHAQIGSGAMVLDFRGGKLVISDRENPRGLTASEVRHIVKVAAANKKRLEKMWREARKR